MKVALVFPLALALALGLSACDRQPTRSLTTKGSDTDWFQDITEQSGVHFVHEVETTGRYLFSESIGSGAALLDFDGDGRLDIFLINNVSPSRPTTNRLFHQQPDGRFNDVSSGSGLEASGYGNGVAVGDINNDGLPEILITEYDRIRLFLNHGKGHFIDVTGSAGLTNANWSVPAAFFDYDRDGWLDLVVGNYLDFDPSQKCPDARGQPDFCGPHGFHSTITKLYHNLGERAAAGIGHPRFEDVTISSGLGAAPGKAMQIVCADFNADHWPDIFITDDGLPNRLFVNQRNGTFKEEAVIRGLAYTAMGTAAANMGIAPGDVDNDGRLDLFVPHLTEENHTFWRQTSPGVYRDDTAAAGFLNISWHGTGFGAVFADFNSDGALDLAVVNGLVRRRSGRTIPKLSADVAPFWAPYAEPAQLFAGDGDGHFREVSHANAGLCSHVSVGRGLACGDFDNNGAPDLLTTSISGPARLYRNTASHRGHWLGIRAIEPLLGGRDAYGAEVRLKTNTRWQMRIVQPAYSYASSNDPRILFGLGAEPGFDVINVIWPDGLAEAFPGGPADCYLTLRKGSGKPANLEAIGQSP